MVTESSIAFKSHETKRVSLAEVYDVERQLWPSVFSRGLLNEHVQNLYRKACGLYEQILIGNTELEELQETEYGLWKLHYRHIDEFRKQTSKSHEKEESKISNNEEDFQGGFKLFLEESCRFYQNLISKVKTYYQFEEPTLFYHTNSISSSIDHTKLHKCRFVCHRLLVRLGDLARYLEVKQKRGTQQRNWSAVAKCYFEAAKMYPDGGNPHNQLALLATPTYIGDEFLALYHCMRSIAAKEPFPDASDNLVFIFERNRSVPIHSLSAGSQFDFLKPSERSMPSAEPQASGSGAAFWSLLVRLTSYFFLDSSLESFSYEFACVIGELEALLGLDDAKLRIALGSPQNVNVLRPGPHRAIHAVSVLIFTVHTLAGATEHKHIQKLNMALTAMFIFMGRVVERCLRGISAGDFTLLPPVMVFSEWLVEALSIVGESDADEKLACATSYLFGTFVVLLNQLDGCKRYVESPKKVALWEDFEMRGFIPVSHCHSSLDFLSNQENETNFRLRNDCRVHRIIQAALRIADKSTDETQSWLFYEKGGKFRTKQPIVEKENEARVETKSPMVEEEEDIVFDPIRRHNSSPLPAYEIENEEASGERGKGHEPPASDDSLRRASSMLIAQNRAMIASMTSQTAPAEGPPPSPRPAPPSLSSWVLNSEKNGNTEEGIFKLFNNNNHGGRFGYAQQASTSTNYCTPTPSAPLLPEGATWFTGNPGPRSPTFIDESPHWFSPSMPPPPPPWPSPQNPHWINNQNNGMRNLHEVYPLVPNSALFNESYLPVHPTYSLRAENEVINDHGFYGRSSPQIYRPADAVSTDQLRLLQHLKEREWMIEQEARTTHSTFTRN